MITLKTLIINAPAELCADIDQIRGPITLVRHNAALRPGAITSPTTSAKAAMRAIARRRLVLHEEIQVHEQELERMLRDKAPELMKSHGISTLTVAEMLILVGDTPDRIRSEAALAKLCGVCPIPASSDKTNRMRLNRGGNRQANAALYRIAIVRMRDDDETKTYALRRTAEGKTRREIVRCIKRYIVRDIHRTLQAKIAADWRLTNIGASTPPPLGRFAMQIACRATVESFFKTIKAELIWRRTWETRRQAETAIFQYINGFYNPRRRHSALRGKCPLAFERQVD